MTAITGTSDFCMHGTSTVLGHDTTQCIIHSGFTSIIAMCINTVNGYCFQRGTTLRTLILSLSPFK